jgi:hypothetical protein
MAKTASVSRRIAIPAIGLALTASWVGVMAHVYSATSTLPPIDHKVARTLFVSGTLDHLNARQASLIAGLPKSLRAAADHEGTRAILARPAVARQAVPETKTASATQPRLTAKDHADRFDAVVKAASLSPQKLAAAFAANNDAVAAMPVAGSDPAADRFDAPVELVSLPSADRFGAAGADANAGYALALALPIANVDTVEQPVAEAAPEAQAPAEPLEQVASLPIPDDVPLPSRRPVLEQPAAKAVAELPKIKEEAPKPTEKAASQKPAPKAVAEKASPKTLVAALAPAAPAVQSHRATSAPVALAYAAPDDGAGSVGKAFNNLFKTQPGSIGGKRVAVYNISAKTVTMPDGQVLKAYSGIGEMANNPKYVGVKMRGPTPPDTYKLKMRESRFHGVEAIRMLPVDGRTKLGRTGILAHTQLLRGRKGQSHGCVAFEDYDKFLKAFKQGKVTHMVVIPGNGRGAPATSGTRVASNGSRG